VIIHRVHVRRFRKLADQVLECGPGLNVIRGRNDAGKSTVHAAFSAALFPIKPSEARTYRPWGEDQSGEITMEFEADGRAYRLHKDFQAQRVRLESDAGQWETAKTVEAEIGKLLGLPSLSLFRATAHIGQWDLAAVQEQKEEIGARLSRIVTGGDSDSVRILKALDERIRTLEVGLRGQAKTPGPLKRDVDRIQFLQAEQQRLAGEVAAIEQAAAERDRLAVRLAELRRQVEDDAALLDANRQLRELDRQSGELSRRAAELRSLLDRIETASRDVEAASRDEALGFSPAEPHVLDRLRDTLLQIEMLGREVARRETPLPGVGVPPAAGGVRAAEAPRVWFRRQRAFAWTGAFAGVTALAVLARVVALALGRAASLGEVLLLVAIAALAAVIGGLAGVAAGLVRRQATAAADRETRTREREEAERDVDALRQEIAAARAAVDRGLRGLGVSRLEEAFDRQQRLEGARRKVDEARRVLEALLGGRPRGSLAAEHQRVLVELGAVEARRDDPSLAPKRLDPAAFQRLQTDAGRRRQELEPAQGALHSLEGRLKGRSPYEDLARLEEELAETRARHARLERHVEVLKLTREVLFEAHRHTIVPGKERLEERAGRYLRALSGGAYDRVQVDTHTLAPRVWVGPPKEDGWADVVAREIGSGAVDQCYLALRLALVDLLPPDGRRPPLFLDDPFLAYDERRQAAAMQLLGELAHERQIFLFTCRGVYDPYADQLIVLEQSGAVAARSPIDSGRVIS